MRLKSASLALSLCLLAGCGGGSSSVSTSGGTAQSLSLGNATIQYSGIAKPLVQASGSGNTTSVAMAGATFSSFLFNPPKDVATLPIVFVTNGGTLYLYQNGTSTAISSPALGKVSSAVFTPSGQILCVATNSSGTATQLFLCNQDGSGITGVSHSTHIVAATRATVTPDGSTIVYDDKQGNIYTSTLTGANETLQVAQGTDPCPGPDGQLAYTLSSGLLAVGSLTSTGYTSFGTNGTNATFSPDGNELVFYNANYEWVIDAGQGGQNGSFPGSNWPGSFSADSRQLLTIDDVAALLTCTWTGDNMQVINTPPTDIVSSNWAPYLKPKYFLGSSGVVQASASGFLLNQSSNAFSSFFAFTAKTPSSATISAISTGSSTAAQVFKVGADAITVYRYVNGYNLGTIAATPPANTPTMLVSVDSSTGQIGFIAPYVARGAQASEVKKGDVYTVHANFSSVMDGKGVNKAPHGATELTVNLKTGTLISLR